MLILKEKYAKYVYLIAFILMLVIGTKTVQGLNCVQCSGNCDDSLKTEPTACSGNETQCFTRIDKDGKIQRGCLATTDTTCTKENKCVATGDKLNNQLVCKTCSATDAKCSQTNVEEGSYSQICEAGITKCIKKISDKSVVRGCATTEESTQCPNDKTCATCETVNCNKDIFPSDRLQCHHCSDTDCNDVTSTSTNLKPCLLYQEKDECYTTGDSESTMKRGCKSDTNGNPCAAATCNFCTDSGCNNAKFGAATPLKCHICTGNANNTECYKTQTGTNLKTCEGNVANNQTQYCYTQITKDKIERGCLSNNTALKPDTCKDAEGGSCYKCSEDGCNSSDGQFTCIRCRSDDNVNCWNKATEIKGESCNATTNPSAQGCFQGVWYGVAIRGCTADATLQVQALCAEKDNPNKCEICYEKNCNNKPSSAAKFGFSFALMSFVLLRVTLWSFK